MHSKHCFPFCLNFASSIVSVSSAFCKLASVGDLLANALKTIKTEGTARPSLSSATLMPASSPLSPPCSDAYDWMEVSVEGLKTAQSPPIIFQICNEYPLFPPHMRALSVGSPILTREAGKRHPLLPAQLAPTTPRGAAARVVNNLSHLSLENT